jgi:hypothetical protein
MNNPGRVTTCVWQLSDVTGPTNTIRNTVIGCGISEAVHLKSLLDHISIAVQDLIIADKCSTY